MPSYNQHNPRCADLLHKAVTEPGVVSKAFSRFHQYSLGNQLLALVQCEGRGREPGPIATYPRWKELGRHVREGEKALTLCMPITVKRTETVEKDGQQVEQEAHATWFAYKNHWFVLSQTDGREYEPEPTPGWNAETALSMLGIEWAAFTMLDGNIQGFARNREVAINPIAEQPESTLFHEPGHVVLGQRQKDRSIATPRIDTTRYPRTGSGMRGHALLRVSRASWRRGITWLHSILVHRKRSARTFLAANFSCRGPDPEGRTDGPELGG